MQRRGKHDRILFASVLAHSISYQRIPLLIELLHIVALYLFLEYTATQTIERTQACVLSSRLSLSDGRNKRTHGQ